jgi:hypothetical protein
MHPKNKATNIMLVVIGLGGGGLLERVFTQTT